MEPYSSRNSRESREDSQDYSSHPTSRTTGTDSSFATLPALSTSGYASLSTLQTAPSTSALGAYHRFPGQDQSYQSQVQPPSSQVPLPIPQFEHYPRFSRSYNSTPNPASHPPSQNPNLQSWEYQTSSQVQSATSLLQTGRSLDQNEFAAKAQYGSGSQQPLQTNMSIVGPQYFADVETSLNRSSHTWPVFEQQHSYSGEPRYVESFSEQAITSRPQSTSSTPPRMMSMSLPTQRESRQLQQVRRDSKTRFRRERSHSNSFNPSLSTTPEAIPRSLAIDDFPLSQSTSDAGHPRLPMQQFNTSLQLSGSQQPNAYQQPYALGMAEYSNSFLLPYSTAPLNSSISSFPSRPMATNSISNPDLGTYYRQPSSAPNLIANPNHPADSSADSVRVVLTRPKPQCWDHGCNGRAFSTFSNLLRHQREKNGIASKPTCPNCGAEFTRTTARNGHMAHEKCKKA